MSNVTELATGQITTAELSPSSLSCPFLVSARRHARRSHTLPVERLLRFRYGSARTTLRCDASNAGRSRSSSNQTLHRGSRCTRELDAAAGLERWS
jgi:hypothetical protein